MSYERFFDGLAGTDCSGRREPGECGAALWSVAQRFGVWRKTVQRYVGRAARGELAPRPLPGQSPGLRSEQEEAFVAMVQEKVDWTVDGLCVEWESRSGVLLPRSTLHDALQRQQGTR